MKFRKNSQEAVQINAQMTPLIDITFLLLIFFLLTLKITPEEGEFSINMPIESNKPSVDFNKTTYLVELKANPDGTLNTLIFMGNSMGNSDDVYRRLNKEVGEMVGTLDKRILDDVNIKIKADYNLNYKEAVKAVSACTGYIDPETGQVKRYVEKVDFAESEKPK